MVSVIAQLVCCLLKRSVSVELIDREGNIKKVRGGSSVIFPFPVKHIMRRSERYKHSRVTLQR